MAVFFLLCCSFVLGMSLGEYLFALAVMLILVFSLSLKTTGFLSFLVFSKKLHCKLYTQ